MTAAKKLVLVSVDEYLAGELESEFKHEYLGGVVYAMAGARNVHNSIATNTLVAFGIALRGKPCRTFNSDMKIRIRLPSQWRFYYPDASVIHESNPPTDTFQDKPVVIAEVMSESTRRIDEGEKKDVYLTIPSLRVYLLIEQDFPGVVVFRRTGDDFAREVYEGLDAVIPLEEIGTELMLKDVYEDVQFTSVANDEE